MTGRIRRLEILTIVAGAVFVAGCPRPSYTTRQDARLRRVCGFWSCAWERDGRRYSSSDLDEAVADDPRARRAASSASTYRLGGTLANLYGGLCMGVSLLWADLLERDDQPTTPALVTFAACIPMLAAGVFLTERSRTLTAKAVAAYNDDAVARAGGALVDLIVHLATEAQEDLSQVLFTLVPGRPAPGTDLEEVRRGNGWTSSTGGMSLRDPARFASMPPGTYTLCVRLLDARDPLFAEGFWRWAPTKAPACRAVVLTPTPPVQETTMPAGLR